ncbi:unnamed protein product [Rotaria socialis]|uniref:Uncharacterized protein n=2 Tax=Rotaria socialis TaxID=392032 RepID=A0A818A4K0_9BILA|nr:unnamed protein product [Rotaria socialis]CAF4495941.1 unnamed protein product [Rotaria socialis]CAF4844932.1 unnamed protein product [Rotaria socialis]
MDEAKFIDLTTSCQSLLQGLALTKNDACRIFQNKTVFYVGDASIRTLFRDLAKMLTNGEELTNIEVAVENGEYQPIQGNGHLNIDILKIITNAIPSFYEL